MGPQQRDEQAAERVRHFGSSAGQDGTALMPGISYGQDMAKEFPWLSVRGGEKPPHFVG